MTSGYDHHPVFRLSPTNGPDVDLDLRALLTDAGGPTRIDVNWKPVNRRGETITRRDVQSLLGYELDVRFRMIVQSMSDAAVLTRIQRAFARPDVAVLLSLDNGAVFRGVRLTRWLGPDAIGGKTFAGTEYQMTVRGVALDEELPVVGSLSGVW